MDPKGTFRLLLRAQPHHRDESGALRMRHLLKVLLRQFGFRCLRFEALTPEDRRLAGDAPKTSPEGAGSPPKGTPEGGEARDCLPPASG
jgi:hypothetical protein